jgi:hypothetical protein
MGRFYLAKATPPPTQCTHTVAKATPPPPLVHTHLWQEPLIIERKQGREDLFLGQVTTSSQHHHRQAGPAPVCCFKVVTLDWISLNSLWEGGGGEHIRCISQHERAGASFSRMWESAERGTKQPWTLQRYWRGRGSLSTTPNTTPNRLALLKSVASGWKRLTGSVSTAWGRMCVCVWGGGVSSSRGADQCCRESVQHAAATAYAGLPVIDAAAAAAAVPIGPRQMSLQLLVKLSQAAPSIMATLNWVMSLMLSWQRFHTDTLPLAGFQPLPGRLSSCSSLVSMSAQTLTVSILTPTAGNKFQMTPPTHTPFTSDPVVLPAALPPAAHPAQH